MHIKPVKRRLILWLIVSAGWLAGAQSAAAVYREIRMMRTTVSVQRSASDAVYQFRSLTSPFLLCCLHFIADFLSHLCLSYTLRWSIVCWYGANNFFRCWLCFNAQFFFSHFYSTLTLFFRKLFIICSPGVCRIRNKYLLCKHIFMSTLYTGTAPGRRRNSF